MSTSQQREFRADSVPQEHRNRVINQFHVEFLNYDRVISTGDPVRDALRQGKKKNHVIFRVVFAQPAPGGIQAARISMDVVLDDVGSTEAVYAGSNASDDPAVTDGAFNVKLVRYAGTSTSALSSFTFSVRNNTTLGQLLDVALSRQMHRFKFTVLYSLAYMGCRDFMSQYFHQLQANGLVGPNVTASAGRGRSQLTSVGNTFNQIIGWRYSPSEVDSDSSTDIQHGPALRFSPSPIDRGIFKVYQRAQIPNLWYSTIVPIPE